MIKRVYLRADGGPQTGWGHVNRMCALAAILKDEAQVVAVSGTAGAEVFRKNIGNLAEVQMLSEHDCGDCREEWKNTDATHALLVLDGYQFDYRYQQEAKELGFRVVLIDDFAQGPFAADMVINHAPNSRRLYQQEGISYCCGLDYALLRPSFYGAQEAPERKQNQVLLTLGGADPLGLTAQLLTKLLPQFPNLQWVVIYTDSFTTEHSRQLIDLAEYNTAITLKKNMNETAMQQLMLESAHALVSASTVVLEAWSCGLFPAALCYTDNQRIMFEGVISEHLAFPLTTENAVTEFGDYLQSEKRATVDREGWNPPAAFRSALQQIMHA
ncbi:MAG: hypothetical protein KJS92_05325 [Bacteroidetes bacterium]|nr:hypothetical protein [Bacteroidota bacterium]